MSCNPYRPLWMEYWQWRPTRAESAQNPMNSTASVTAQTIGSPIFQRKQRPLPFQLRGPVDLHPWLRFSSQDVNLPLHIDLTVSPEEMMRQRAQTETGTRLMDFPATRPGLPSMTIVHPLIPWPITVWHYKFGHITIEDVILTLLEQFQTQLLNVDGVYVPPEYRRPGGKRYDMLQGRTKMIGLQRCDYGGDIWILMTV
jgi:hypothetical protein